MMVSPRSTLPTRWQLSRAALVLAGFTLLLISIFTIQSAQESLRLDSNQVSPRTILAPERVTFASEIQTREARSKAQAQVKDVYDSPDANLAREQVRWASRVLDYVDALRHDPYSTADQKIDWVQSIPTVTVSLPTLRATFALDETAFHRIVTETIYVLDQTMREPIRTSDLATEYQKASTRISLALTGEQADIVTQWSRVFIVPNTFANPIKTAEQRAIASEQVGTVYRTIEKGQAIVREGEVVTPLAFEALQAAGFIHPNPLPIDYAGPALFAALLALLIAIYVLRARTGLIANVRALLLLASVILIFAAGARLIGAERSWLQYLYPISAAAMLLAVLVDSSMALAAAWVLALAFGFFMHYSLELTLYALAGGIIAALSLGRIERLPSFLWSGVFVGLINLVVVAVFRLLARESDLMVWGQFVAVALGNGLLSGLLALGSVFVLGKSFGIPTSLELFDLARPTHPLLKKLLVEAPGTYHHSLIVGQLGEQAAQAIGADALLVRVAAYYHDVGKTGEPQLFIENQLDGLNAHDELQPQQSAGIVIDHVSRGMALAKAYGVPARVREFIPQHHGTTLAAYFHRKAVQANGHAGIDEKNYRYPGPKPQTREAAILMLADSVEATTRAERPVSHEQIRAIIDRIVADRLRDGQLDESDLTLRDLQKIKGAFADVLQGLFHPRIKYPEPVPPQAPEQIDVR